MSFFSRVSEVFFKSGSESKEIHNPYRSNTKKPFMRILSKEEQPVQTQNDKDYMLQRVLEDVLRTKSPGLPTLDYAPQYNSRSYFHWAYFLETEVSVVSDILQKKRDECFRNGIEWKPKFAIKCIDCGKEYAQKTDTCDKCGGMDFREPDKNQLEWFKRPDGTDFMEKANMNNMSLVAVLKEYDLHLEVSDNPYMLCVKKYKVTPEGTIDFSLPYEFMALDPRDTILKFNDQGQKGKAGKICLAHREALLSEEDLAKEKQTRCNECGMPLYDVWYEVQSINSATSHYTQDEVYFQPSAYPGWLYGYPVLLKILDDLWAYHYIEKRTRAFYETARAPGLLFIPTTNQAALEEAWTTIAEQIKQDPYTMPVIATSESAPTQANLIKFLNDPNTDLNAVKMELRERIASRLGVTVTMTNDAHQAGNADSKHLITVTDRTIDGKQKYYNEGLFKWIARQFNITDFELVCKPHLAKNEMNEEKLFGLCIQNARGMMEMGFDVSYNDRKFSFSGQPMNLMQIQQMQAGVNPQKTDKGYYDAKGNWVNDAENPDDQTHPARKPEPQAPQPAKFEGKARGNEQGSRKKRLSELFGNNMGPKIGGGI